MSDKKKKGKRAYLSDYVLDVNGEYVYTGAYYMASVEHGKDFARVMRAISGLAVLSFAFLVGIGCLSTGTTSGAFYVTVPYVAAIVFTAISIYDSFAVAGSKGKLKAHLYENNVSRLKGMSFAGTIASFAAAAGQLGYVIFAGNKYKIIADLLFLAGCFAAGALLLVTFRLQKHIMWQKHTDKGQKSIDKIG